MLKFFNRCYDEYYTIGSTYMQHRPLSNLEANRLLIGYPLVPSSMSTRTVLQAWCDVWNVAAGRVEWFIVDDADWTPMFQGFYDVEDLDTTRSRLNSFWDAVKSLEEKKQ